MQGHLRSQPLTVSVTSECGHCGQPLHLEIDSHLNYKVLDPGAKPLIFAPMPGEILDKSIIDKF